MKTKTTTPITTKSSPVYSMITDIDREKFFTNWNEGLLIKTK